MCAEACVPEVHQVVNSKPVAYSHRIVWAAAIAFPGRRITVALHVVGQTCLCDAIDPRGTKKNKYFDHMNYSLIAVIRIIAVTIPFRDYP